MITITNRYRIDKMVNFFQITPNIRITRSRIDKVLKVTVTHYFVEKFNIFGPFWKKYILLQGNKFDNHMLCKQTKLNKNKSWAVLLQKLFSTTTIATMTDRKSLERTRTNVAFQGIFYKNYLFLWNFQYYLTILT